MKKFKITIVLTLISLCLALILFIGNKNSTKNFIKYAILVNDEELEEFPEKGLYKVEVNCKNAKCYWDYDNWKLIVKEITGTVNCDISFTSLNKTQLNNHVISLENTTQGKGKLTKEIDKKSLDNANYSIVNMDYTNISGNSVSNQNNKFTTTNTSTQKESINKFIFKESGWYKVCYSIPASSSSGGTLQLNDIYFYTINNTTAIQKSVYSNGSNGETKSACYTYGYVTKNDFVYIKTYFYDQNLSFWFERTNDVEDVNTGYRYQGKDPNNYMLFNNELWRIIGVFDENSHGLEGKKLVKIIKDESIGGLMWDSAKGSDWSKSSLYKLLNNYYYNSTNGTNSGYCYISSNSLGNCNYTYSGISSKYRLMLENVEWNLGKIGELPIEAYENERSGLTYEGNSTKVNGYVGIMYASDYKYSVDSSNCSRTISSYSSNPNCVNNLWLKGLMWTIAIPGTSNYAVGLGAGGNLFQTVTNAAYSIFPTVYLKEDTYIIKGNGSLADPYIIGMD